MCSVSEISSTQVLFTLVFSLPLRFLEAGYYTLKVVLPSGPLSAQDFIYRLVAGCSPWLVTEIQVCIIDQGSVLVTPLVDNLSTSTDW